MTATPAVYDMEWFGQKIGKSADWVRHNIGKIPHRRIGRSIAFTDADLAAYLDQSFVQPKRMQTTGRRRSA